MRFRGKMVLFVNENLVKRAVWILFLFGTLLASESRHISSSEDSIEIEEYEDSDYVPTRIKETPILILDVDAACDDETDSLREFLVALSDHGFTIKTKGLHTETLTIENIDELMCSMTSYSTDILERNILETFKLGLPNVRIHLIGNRFTDDDSRHYGDLDGNLKEILNRFPTMIDVWEVQECLSKGHRVKRQSGSSMNTFQKLAQLSGGSYINTTKGNIGQVANLLKQSVKANTVDILRLYFRRPLMSTLQVPVDDTMTQLTIRLTTPSTAPVAMTKNPMGIPVSFAPGSGNSIQNLGQKISLMEFNITTPMHYGSWEFQKLDQNTEWEVVVTGQSPVDFTYDFLQAGPGGYGQFAIKGRPIAGEQHKLKITVPEYNKVQSVLAASFLTETNVPFQVITLKNLGGRRGKAIFYSNLTMPKDSFMVAIEGKDKSNHAFKRLNPFLVQPVTLKLVVPSTSGVKLYKNETLEIPFTVINAASIQQDTDVKIDDDKQFALFPKMISFLLKPGTNATGKFKIKGGLTVGETTTVTILARLGGRQNINSPGQYEVRRFTVEERPKNTTQDKINPTCNVTNVVGTCNIGSDLCACVNHTWTMDVVVGDEGFGLRDIFPTGAGSNQSFTHDNFTIGHTISQGVIHASIGADCCHQTATIEVVDKAGNVASCTPNITQNFKPPDPSHCNSTQLNVTIPCVNTKITGTCGNFPANPCDCHNKGWHMEVTFGSVGWNLYNVFTVNAGNNASLQTIGNVTELDSDCCYQQITIMAEDIAGNIGQCNVTIGNFSTPKPSDCTTTTTSTSTTTTPTTTTVTTTTTKTSASSAPSSTKSSAAPSGTSPVSTKSAPTTSKTSAAKTGTSSQTASSTGAPTSNKEKTSNGDHLTTGIVAGAMSGAGVIALAAIVVMALVIWKALSKAKVGPATPKRRRRDSTYSSSYS